MDFHRTLSWGAKRIAGNNRINGKHEARDLLRRVIGKGFDEAFEEGGSGLDYYFFEQYSSLIDLLKKDIPLPLLLGEVAFRNIILSVRPGVFIPRPETEIVVGVAADYIMKNGYKNIWDLGCGSGAIALSLANEIEGLNVIGTDISKKAVNTAEENSKINKLSSRVAFYQGDFTGALKDTAIKRFDMIISNPPYIPTWQLKALPRQVKHFEPLEALDGGEHGLKFYQRISDYSVEYLKGGGRVVLEIGMGQENLIEEIFEKRRCWTDIECFNDYAGIKRIMVVLKK